MKKGEQEFFLHAEMRLLDAAKAIRGGRGLAINIEGDGIDENTVRIMQDWIQRATTSKTVGPDLVVGSLPAGGGLRYGAEARGVFWPIVVGIVFDIGVPGLLITYLPPVLLEGKTALLDPATKAEWYEFARILNARNHLHKFKPSFDPVILLHSICPLCGTRFLPVNYQQIYCTTAHAKAASANRQRQPTPLPDPMIIDQEKEREERAAVRAYLQAKGSYRGAANLLGVSPMTVRARCLRWLERNDE